MFSVNLKMKTNKLCCVLSGIASAALLATRLAAAEPPREHLSIDANWKFHLGDDWPDALPGYSIAVGDWRWQLAKVPHNNSSVPEYVIDLDDSAWNTLNANTSGGEPTIKTPDTTAVDRAHSTMAEEDLNGTVTQVCFSGCDDEGCYFVNGQYVRGIARLAGQPIFDIKKFMHSGDNVIAMGVNNSLDSGGLNPNVAVKTIGRARVTPWPRSLFNGMAQVTVQSTRDAGAIKLTATAEGLSPATTSVQTQLCVQRPFMR